jgi:DNA-binding CsgD family transcriptional regulator
MARKKKRLKSISSSTTYWQFLSDQNHNGDRPAEPSEANPDVLAQEEQPENVLEYRALKLRAFEEARLTERERWLLGYIIVGHSQSEAATKLGISPAAVSEGVAAARLKILRTYTRLSLLFRLGVKDVDDRDHSGTGD